MIDRVPPSRRLEVARRAARSQTRSDVVSDPGVAKAISGTRIGTAGRLATALALLGALSCGRAAVSSCDGCDGSDRPSSSLSDLESSDPSPVVYPDRTLHEMDEHLADKKAAEGKKYRGFSCTGTEIADGECN